MNSQLEALFQNIRHAYHRRFDHTSQELYPARARYDNTREETELIPVRQSRPVHKWMQLAPQHFPPAQDWSDHQLRELCSMLRSLFEAYHYIPVIPFSLAYPEEYTWLLRALRSVEINTLSHDLHEPPVAITFCERAGSHCPFGRHCPGTACHHQIKTSTERGKYLEEC